MAISESEIRRCVWENVSQHSDDRKLLSMKSVSLSESFDVGIARDVCLQSYVPKLQHVIGTQTEHAAATPNKIAMRFQPILGLNMMYVPTNRTR